MAGGRIKGITIELNGDSTKLEASLKSVNSEIRNTESKLKDVNKLLKMDPGNTNLLSQKYKTLQTEIGSTKEKLNTLKEAAKQADQALADGKMSQDQYDALQREIAETEQSLRSLEQEYKNFGSVQAQQVAAAGEKMKELDGKMESAGKTLTTHVTLPLAAVGAAGVASFAEVDKTMQLTNKTMGNTEEQAELLNKAMKDAAANSTFGMKDAATATLNFARAGLDAEQAAAALAPAMNLAAGEGGNLDTVSGGLVTTINGFHGSFEDAGHYADVFAAACNNSALDVDSLSSATAVWTEKTEDKESKIVPADLTSVPDELKNKFSSIKDLKDALLRALSFQGMFTSEENSVFYDVVLMVRRNGGPWVPATKEDFENGPLTVKLAYPAGTGMNTHHFRVAHMFTANVHGHTPGEIEIPQVTKQEDGIYVNLDGLSPVAISWTKIDEKAIDSLPQTGDTERPLLYGLVALLACIGIGLMTKKK